MTSRDGIANRPAALTALYDDTLDRVAVPYESQFVATRFGKTHLLSAGSDNPDSIILLHGTGSSAAACWPLINDLANSYRVLAIDIPRHLGKTEPFRLSTRGDDYAKWLVDILDTFSLDKAHFIGFSFGGWVTLKLAAVADERIAKMVLISPVGIVNFRSGYFMCAPFLFLRALLTRSEKSMKDFARFIAGPSAPQPMVDEIAIAGRVFINNFYMPGAPVRPSRQDLNNSLSPTLVLLGQYDAFCEPTAVLSRLRANLPDVQGEIIPDAGHALLYEHADMVNARILEFLSSDM